MRPNSFVIMYSVPNISFRPVGEGLQMDSSLQREDQLDERARPRHTKKTMSLGARVRRAIPFQQIKILIGENTQRNTACVYLIY